LSIKLAYIILAHANPEQTFRLIRKLNYQGASFALHISKNCEAQFFEKLHAYLKGWENCYFAKRVKVNWGDFSIVQASINAIDCIVENQIDYDYVILLSGQDYPIESNEAICHVLRQFQGKQLLEYEPVSNEYKDWIEKYHFRAGRYNLIYPYQTSDSTIRKLSNLFFSTFLPKKRTLPHGYKPYKGAFWWILTKDCIEYLHRFIHSGMGIKVGSSFRYTKHPAEFFYQTILKNSTYNETINNNAMRFILWNNDSGHPKVLTENDYNAIVASNCLFARKFDTSMDKAILDLLDIKTTKE